MSKRRQAPRKPFNYSEFTACADAPHRDQEANRIMYGWLADKGDRAALYRALESTGYVQVPSRVRHEDDPAPPLNAPNQPLQGHDTVYLITKCCDIEHVLENKGGSFSNRPYRTLGTGAFMLGLDRPDDGQTPDWHKVQRDVGVAAIAMPAAITHHDLCTLCQLAFDQAAVISLARKHFDLADFSEQVALRFCQVLFGFAASDFALLEDALRRGYRALTYQNFARHFLSEPDAVPAARDAMARLLKRTDELLREYDRVKRYPDEPPPSYSPNPQRHGWPEGVTPISEYGLSGITPLMKSWAGHLGPLSGEQLAVLVVGMMTGIVGNVQAGVCIAVEHILSRPCCANSTATDRLDDKTTCALMTEAFALDPPVPFLPRLVSRDVCLPSGLRLKENDQLILCIGAATTKRGADYSDALIFGGAKGMHSCIGKHLAQPLMSYTVRETLRLPGLAERLDPVTGEVLGLEKRWGFACESYPFEYRRDRRLAQQPLQVIMRVKSPVAENSAKLRRLIRDGAPKIERALRQARHVHFAWFQLIDGDTQLVLQTVYDGDFDAYIEHFALKVDDVFDQLFQYIEDAPPLPVGDFPEAFVETIRRFNRAPVAGYFFSAYPDLETWNALRTTGGGQ
jgi:hypothetical protein